MAQKHLPQFPRFFSAKFIEFIGVSLLLTGLIALFVYNTSQRFIQPQPFWNERLSALTDPMSPVPHINFAHLLWENKDFAKALTELRIADAITKSGSGLTQPSGSGAPAVLGAVTSPLELLDVWKEAPQKAAERLEYWKRIAAKYPDYRDAYILAGVMALQAGQFNEAASYLKEAARLDPNNKTVRQLMEISSADAGM